MYLHEQLKQAGNYLLTAGDRTIAALSFNYGNKESDPSIYSIKEVEEILQKNNIINNTEKRYKKSKRLWIFLVGF